jgi:hypothetical protein
LTVERTVLYLKPGVKSTERLIEAVVSRVKRGDISGVIVASLKGKIALTLASALKKAVLVASITEFTYDDDIKKTMKKVGVIAIEKVNLPIQDRPEMREALQIFGNGVKASLEVASIAAEKGIVEGKIITVAGSKGGLDTALVVRPSTPADFLNPDPSKRIAVLEIMAVPFQE